MFVPIYNQVSFHYDSGQSSTTCSLRLWYWLSGPEPGSLHVQVISASDEVTEAWMVDGNHGDTWNLVCKCGSDG